MIIEYFQQITRVRYFNFIVITGAQYAIRGKLRVWYIAIVTNTQSLLSLQSITPPAMIVSDMRHFGRHRDISGMVLVDTFA